AGDVHLDVDGVVAGFRVTGIVTQQIRATQLDTHGCDCAFELMLLAEVNLRPSRRGSQSGERIGALFRGAASAQNGNQVEQVHARLETASLAMGDALR